MAKVLGCFRFEVFGLDGQEEQEFMEKPEQGVNIQSGETQDEGCSASPYALIARPLGGE